MTEITKRQRDRFSAYLRNRCNLTAYISHQVAREPGRTWYMVRCGDGMVRAWHNRKSRDWWIRSKSKFAGFTRETWAMRWTKDPQP